MRSSGRSRPRCAEWHPLTWLSHGLDCKLFLYSIAARHHEMNVLLQSSMSVLVFWMLESATGYTGRSFMVAALFALHPINVESVAWIAERKNLLSMLFFSAGAGSIRLVCAKAARRSLRGGRIAVRAGAYGQTSGDYFSMPSVAVGLLAFTADVAAS